MELPTSECHAVPSRYRDCLLISEHKAGISFWTIYSSPDYSVWLNNISYCHPNCYSGDACPLSVGLGRLDKHLFPKLHLAWYLPSSGWYRHAGSLWDPCPRCSGRDISMCLNMVCCGSWTLLSTPTHPITMLNSSIPDRPARSQSLYRLSYSVHVCCFVWV